MTSTINPSNHETCDDVSEPHGDCDAPTPHSFASPICSGKALDAEPKPVPEPGPVPEPAGAGNFVSFDRRATTEFDLDSLDTKSFRPVRPREVGRGPRHELTTQPAKRSRGGRQTRLYDCSLEVYERPRVGATIATVIAVIAGILLLVPRVRF